MEVYAGSDILNNPGNTAPIGTGHFKFVSYVPGQHVIMERNPNYWMPGLPYLDRVVIRAIADAPAAVAALESRDVMMSLFSSLPRTAYVPLRNASPSRRLSKSDESTPQ